MKIVVLSGSPRKKGTSALLVDEFIAGAQEKGHEVTRFDCAFQKVGPCRGCEYCIAHEGECVQKDDMAEIRPAILDADMVVFASGVYYYGISAQVKTVMDRFFAFNPQLLGSGKKAALLLTWGDRDETVQVAPVAHFRAVCNYLGWQEVGMVLADNVYARADIEASDYPAKARALGASL